jgi:arylsulfatase
MDMLPTIIDVCKAKLPSKKIDGVNVIDLFLAKKNANPRDEFVYYYDRNNLKAVRKGNWKLVFPSQSQTYNIPGAIGHDGFPGKTGNIAIPLSLFDLSKDPGEDRDVKELHPEIVKQITAIADKYRKEIGDGLTNTIGAEVRPAAKLN